MKFTSICLVALASLDAAHAFASPPSSLFAVTHQQQQYVNSASANKRDVVVVFMGDEDFDEEDFVDDGTGASVTSSPFQSGSGRLGEHPVMVVEPVATKKRGNQESTAGFVEAEAVVSSTPASSKMVDGDEDVDPSKMSVKDIKAELDSWGVSYDDCFEKIDLVKRLYITRKSPSQQIGQQLRVELSAAGRKEKDQLRSFGYVGLTEEEFFEQQAAQARTKRGRVEQSPVNQATPNAVPVSGRRQGGSIWLEDTPAPKKQRTRNNPNNSFSAPTPSIQLEDTPAPPKKKNRPINSNTYTTQPQGVNLESDRGAPARPNPGQQRTSKILLEDLPGPNELPFASKRRRQPVEMNSEPATRREVEAPRIKVPTADVKGYVGLTEDEYFSQHAAAMNWENQRVASVLPKTRVPFGMTEEEFLTQQRKMGIVNPGANGVAPQQQTPKSQGGVRRGMSEQEYWSSRREANGGNKSGGLAGGLSPDQLL